jgi:hypothetical protein
MIFLVAQQYPVDHILLSTVYVNPQDIVRDVLMAFHGLDTTEINIWKLDNL